MGKLSTAIEYEMDTQTVTSGDEWADIKRVLQGMKDLICNDTGKVSFWTAIVNIFKLLAQLTWILWRAGIIKL